MLNTELVSTLSVFGYVDELDVPLEKLNSEVSECLIGSYFEKTWNEMHKALKGMRELYPDRWKDLGVYAQLINVLEAYYFDMGMTLSNTDDGLYIDVPFRQENTPAF